MLRKIIHSGFYLLLLVTPQVWSSRNFELFEFNKMLAVYLLTILIVGCWVVRMLTEKKLIIKRTPLDIPIMLFLLANILSTIFSIDPHTSWWGYYSRSNGGLLSTLSYITLYYAFVSNVTKAELRDFLLIGVLGGLVVSLYAIPEHFGVSPSCVLLHNQWNDACWVQDVQSRVFATLGQPNWLAAYLAMLIFPALYFFVEAKSLGSRTFNLLLIVCLYLAFTFTYSQGGTLGLIGGAITLIGLLLLKTIFKTEQRFHYIGQTALVTILFVLINGFYGSGLSRLNLTQYFIHPSPTPAPITAKSPTPSSGPVESSNPSPAPVINQLENGGTDSGKIRLIVWRGAFEVFKHYPFFGSGVETFAYSYYQFRPAAHNLVSEWDFLYNKAHNEYLNYLATTGAFGFLTYVAMILYFLFWSIKYLVLSIKQTKPVNSLSANYLLLSTLLASYVSYLVQNFFSFSVVIISVYFFLIPGFIMVYTTNLRDLKFKFPDLARSELVRLTTLFAVGLIMLYGFWSISQIWAADRQFALGSNLSDAGVMTKAYQALSKASNMRPDEPYYRNELGFAAGSLALLAADQDATLSAELKDQAAAETSASLKESPKNVSFYRTALRTYYELSALDKNYLVKTLQTIDTAISLAPTDAKLYYNKGLILAQTGKPEEGIKSIEQAIQLKSNYREAYLSLGDIYKDLKQFDKAKGAYQTVLSLVPNDPEALDKLKKLEADNPS